MKIVIRGKTSFPCDKDWKKRGKKCAGRQARKNTKKIESKWNLWHESCTGVEKFIFLIKKRGRGMDEGGGGGELRGLLLTVVVSKVNLGDRTVLQSSALQGGRVY